MFNSAIPEPWIDDIELSDDPGFTVFGSLPERKRKIREYSISELSSKPTSNLTEKVSPTLLNKRSSSQISIASSSVQDIADIDSHITRDHSGETYKIETKRSKADNNMNESIFEEVVLLPQTQKTPPKFRYLYLKSKGKSEKKNTPIMTNIESRESPKPDSDTEQFVKIEEDEEEVPSYFTLDADISSTNLDDKRSDPTQVSSPENAQQTVSTMTLPAGCKEFIFEGKIWVQMEKELFEGELEKVRKEADRYKSLLRKLKGHLNKLDL